MSFIKQVMSRYRVTAGDIVNFQAFKDKNKKPDTKRVMDDFLSLVADALTKAGWKVGDPKPGSDVLDVWGKNKKQGFIELTCTGVMDNREIGGTLVGMFTWGRMDDENESYDIEVEIGKTVDLSDLTEALTECFDYATEIGVGR